jgi:hypothetical protein
LSAAKNAALSHHRRRVATLKKDVAKEETLNDELLMHIEVLLEQVAVNVREGNIEFEIDLVES